MNMLKERLLKAFIAMIVLVGVIFAIETGIGDGIPSLNVIGTDITFTDQQKYKLDGKDVGLSTFYLDGSMEGISRDNKVKLNWRFENKQGTLECEIQGATSAGFPKKNYNISKIEVPFDVGWGMRSKYTLKADYIDCSHARNIIGAKLWGQIVKSRKEQNSRLQGLPNGGAIDGFPVYLVVNGKYAGIYNLCLSKDKGLFGMSKGNKDCILAAKSHTDVTNFRALTTKQELEEAKKFQIKYSGHSDEWVAGSLNALIKACTDENDTEFVKRIDIDSAIDYYIHACMLGNCDGTDKNFLFSTYDGECWFFTPYDMDALLGNHWAGQSYYHPVWLGPTFGSYHNSSAVMKMVYKFHKDKLKERYAYLRRGILSEANVMTMIYNYMAPIPETMKLEEYKLYPKMPGTNTNTAAQMVEWYRLRCIAMDKEMESL